MPSAEIGIIGGTGVYDATLLRGISQIKVHTPYGLPSDRITLGSFKGRRIAFIPRHGARHNVPPHAVNYRANVWALKQLNVTAIIAPCAVGSLREEIKPGDFVLIDQFVDYTKGRRYSFYDGPHVAHITMAEPFCGALRATALEAAKRLKLPIHDKGTYIVIEGPRFSTRAESKLWRSIGDVVGMTLSPECVLAREAEICYLPIAMVTDYDNFGERVVTAEDVLQTANKNNEKVRRLISELITKILKEQRSCACARALKGAMVG